MLLSCVPPNQRHRISNISQCSIAEQGLGPVAWWKGAEAEAEDGMEEG